MPRIEVNEQLCKGCYLCVKACPKQCIAKSKNFSKTGYYPAVMVKPEACIGCKMCFMVCPDVAITVEK
ncbi:Putative 2-ketovalerate ferredoxin oxidoreductase subunit [Elusimicrobium minutum Pei191]|uniref:Putative 2-ketovalerate ferredoxin oxidoreductase subunit n=1 Tax=Elusimicrobium minutum (strain Pei191) TaxID=445932 RepID=B2KES7_ELUMP|nr:4Fe-4S binding protein [Elusimicrobium minutum]ACC99023.1 Putative 2-ketovalerate ferredoxin oxidoreductase subunit [Elusimicrobium minutum Pei191]